MIVDLLFADTFFNSLTSKYKSKWNEFSNEDKEGALYEAEMDIQTTIRFKEQWTIWDNPPERLKQAICYQAFYSLVNQEDIIHDVNNRNGVGSVSVQGFSESHSQTTLIYPKVHRLLNHLVLRVGRFR